MLMTILTSSIFVITIIVLLQNKHTTVVTINFFALSLQRNVLNPVQIPTLCGIFFEENMPLMIQRYQKEEETWCEVSVAEKSTTVLADFVEHLLGPLSSMKSNEVR